MNRKTGTATAAAPQKVRIGGRKLTWEAVFAIDHLRQVSCATFLGSLVRKGEPFLMRGLAAN
jgi:hypothetical protein